MKTRELTHNLADQVDEVTVVGWNGGGSQSKVVDLGHNRRNLRVILLPGTGPSSIPNAGPYPWIPQLPALLKSLDWDIIHLQSHLNIQALQVARIASSMKKPVVVTVHGVTAKIGLVADAAQRVYLMTVGKHLFNLADGIICLTESDAAEIRTLGVGRNRISVIPNGVNEEFFRYRVEKDDRTVVWHGRLVPQKGLGYFIDAAKLVKRDLPDVRFRMLGTGPQLGAIASRLVSEGIRSSFQLLGRIPWEDVPTRIGESSMYMLSSLREGMPWAVLEAMSCGKPVAAFAIPGVTELVEAGSTGCLSPKGDARGLAAGVVQILRDKELRFNYGRNARKSVETSYTWARVSAQYRNLYEEVLSS